VSLLAPQQVTELHYQNSYITSLFLKGKSHPDRFQQGSLVADDLNQFLPKTEPQYHLQGANGNGRSTQLESVKKQEIRTQPIKPVQTRPENTHGSKSHAVVGYLQSIRKEWQCANGECSEVTTNCENGKCKSVQSKFHAENYQPEQPHIDESKLASINFEELFELLGFPKNFFSSSNNADSKGTMDLVFDKNTYKYYFSNAKYINTKCKNSVCVTTTRTCNNGQCDETNSTFNF
jgi:hypothetical protein